MLLFAMPVAELGKYANCLPRSTSRLTHKGLNWVQSVEIQSYCDRGPLKGQVSFRSRINRGCINTVLKFYHNLGILSGGIFIDEAFERLCKAQPGDIGIALARPTSRIF